MTKTRRRNGQTNMAVPEDEESLLPSSHSYPAGVYNETLVRLRSGAHNLTGPYAFLGDYDYDLGTEELTLMGEQELIHSGIDFFTRYEALATADTPFIRAGDQNRVVESARKWAEGFHKAKVASGAIKNLDYPYGIIEISEAEGMNNTLNHGLCAAFEANKTGLAAQAEFGATFLPEISARLKRDIGTSDLTDTDTLSLMDLCPYTVVAETSFSSSSIRGVKRSISGANPQANPFCALFNLPEWESYDYYQSLGKYYGYGAGSDLGPTQGVGFVNELIARLTSKSVQDSTSVNHTLDSNPKMFPLGKSLYADFSHDNDMTAVFFALGLFEGMPQLRKDRIMSVEEMEGYTASRTVPFGGRMVVEKMTCEGEKEEMIRVIMNGKVMPLVSCSGDEFGRCGLGAFVESLGFAKGGGRWDDCFTESVRTTTIRKPGLDETALASAL
ncbi:uncharacterized protein KY384_000684 [Bacidia gigantensis]|uniref:uncharacterized protein n=1 Tax=Bacidia gigantensis TaxID=2732470 RepID=UPI001D042AAE|nr:uncharacterized protein KY384_000684 [Bacidia gigantensis]KAG8525922.1 hypothetical protein KY384_000684 [Bacidia gigantensis]